MQTVYLVAIAQYRYAWTTCHAPREVPDPAFIRGLAFITYATPGDPALKRGPAFIRGRCLLEEIHYTIVA